MGASKRRKTQGGTPRKPQKNQAPQKTTGASCSAAMMEDLGAGRRPGSEGAVSGVSGLEGKGEAEENPQGGGGTGAEGPPILADQQCSGVVCSSPFLAQSTIGAKKEPAAILEKFSEEAARSPQATEVGVLAPAGTVEGSLGPQPFSQKFVRDPAVSGSGGARVAQAPGESLGVTFGQVAKQKAETQASDAGGCGTMEQPGSAGTVHKGPQSTVPTPLHLDSKGEQVPSVLETGGSPGVLQNEPREGTSGRGQVHLMGFSAEAQAMQATDQSFLAMDEQATTAAASPEGEQSMVEAGGMVSVPLEGQEEEAVVLVRWYWGEGEQGDEQDPAMEAEGSGAPVDAATASVSTEHDTDQDSYQDRGMSLVYPVAQQTKNRQGSEAPDSRPDSRPSRSDNVVNCAQTGQDPPDAADSASPTGGDYVEDEQMLAAYYATTSINEEEAREDRKFVVRVKYKGDPAGCFLSRDYFVGTFLLDQMGVPSSELQAVSIPPGMQEADVMFTSEAAYRMFCDSCRLAQRQQD
uniref:Uncharacterized protein n=1 Tax=Sphaerodactylus townsendi TaxID=933632 RepID=A0ACB8F7H9_9SAUR